MPIALEWGDPDQTSLIFRFENPWTWTEFYEVRPKAEEMAYQSGHKVGAIILLPEKLSLPQGALTQGQAIAKTRPEHVPVSVVVSKSPLVTSLFAVFKRFNAEAAGTYRIVGTLEEAHQIIREALEKA